MKEKKEKLEETEKLNARIEKLEMCLCESLQDCADENKGTFHSPVRSPPAKIRAFQDELDLVETPNSNKKFFSASGNKMNIVRIDFKD